MKPNKIIDEYGNITTLWGDWLPLTIEPTNEDDTPYIFKDEDIVRFRIIKKKDCNCVELQKDFEPTVGSTSLDIDLWANEMEIGDVINKPITYWYEVILNPDTKYELTIIGYKKYEKTLTLTPKGRDKK